MTASDWITLAAVLVPTLAVIITAVLNSRAHDGITKRIDGVDSRVGEVDTRAERRADAQRVTLDSHRSALESIARDVSFMAGRQTERDRTAERRSD